MLCKLLQSPWSGRAAGLCTASWPFCDAVLLPPAAAAAYGDDILVHTAGGDSYTASRGDALRLLHDLGLHQQAAIYPRVANLINPITPLQVQKGHEQSCVVCGGCFSW